MKLNLPKPGMILLILIPIMISCNNKLDIAEKIIINPDEKPVFPESGEAWIKDIKFIPLETSQGNFIGRQIGLRFNDEKILLHSNDKIFVYDIDGQLINSFSHHGRGPGEYTRIASLEIVPDQDQIMVYDLDSYQILLYSYDGQFLNGISLPFRPVRVVPINDDKFVCFMNRLQHRGETPYRYQLVFCNDEGQIQASYFPYTTQFQSVGVMNFSAGSRKGEYFINIPFAFDVHKISPDGDLDVEISLSFGDYDVDTTVYQGKDFISRQDFKNLIGYEKLTELIELNVTENAIAIQSFTKNPKSMGGYRYINRKTGSQLFVPMGKSDPSIMYHGFPMSGSRFSFGSYFAYLADAIDVINTIESLSEDQKKSLAKHVGFNELSELDENDNPVLVLFKVKDF